MIGKLAVDTSTGQLSSVVGARLEGDAVVPLTQSSSKHRRRKPPAGATMALDDEVGFLFIMSETYLNIKT